ncbi:atpI [Symbiodinium necroappetens]|uniref:AtpI protein n=1 Tax=Symbiodinium necroappetens TaxID=1628268 RepID=A0A813AH42_9DINO|nr:atpI [Symbiodinium necroappetens]
MVQQSGCSIVGRSPRQAQLAAEREKCDKAKRKVRQLLAKISERDRKIANLSGKLEAEVALRKSNGRLGPIGRYGGESQQAVAADLAKQRAAIVAQLEDHLAQMRQDLLESEYEIQELESRQSCKEEELGLLAMSDRSPERMQALAMIGLQIQDWWCEKASIPQSGLGKLVTHAHTHTHDIIYYNIL